MRMVIWKEELHRGILYFVRPAFRFMEAIAAGTFKDIINEKQKSGYNSDVVKRYYRVLTRFADYFEKNIDVSYAIELKTVRDILCTMLDEELWWTPRWHNILLNLAKEEGLLEPVQEPD